MASRFCFAGITGRIMRPYRKAILMYNPIKYIKDVIEIVRFGGPGDAICAVEITTKNKQSVLEALGPEAAPYIKEGDFMVEMERLTTVVPKRDFHKHYAFAAVPDPDGNHMTVVVTHKPL